MLCIQLYTVIYISFIFHVVGKIPGSSRLQWRAPLLPAPGWAWRPWRAWRRGSHGAMGHGRHQGGSQGLRHEQPMTLPGMQDYIYDIYIYIWCIYVYIYIIVYIYICIYTWYFVCNVFFSDFHIVGIFLDLLRSSLLNMNADMNACACIQIVHYDRVEFSHLLFLLQGLEPHLKQGTAEIYVQIQVDSIWPHTQTHIFPMHMYD